MAKSKQQPVIAQAGENKEVTSVITSEQQQPVIAQAGVVLDQPNNGTQLIGSDALQPSVVTVSVNLENEVDFEALPEKVVVEIKYPEDWAKEKFMSDGDLKEVSKQTAQTFIELGIATIVK